MKVSKCADKKTQFAHLFDKLICILGCKATLLREKRHCGKAIVLDHQNDTETRKTGN